MKMRHNGHNTKFGRDILLIGSVHGNELTPSDAIYMFEQQLMEPILKDVRSITTIKWANVSGIKAGTREFNEPEATSDINRLFDDGNEGIDTVVDGIKQGIINASAVIDVHSSPNCTPMVLINVDEYSESYVQFCKDNDLAYALRYNGNPTIKKYASKGCMAFTVELNGINSINYVDSSRGAMFLSKLIKAVAKWTTMSKATPISPVLYEAKHHCSGLFCYPMINVGGMIKQGDVVGSLIDITKSHIEGGYMTDIVYNGPMGMVITLSDSSYITPNEPYMLIQPT